MTDITPAATTLETPTTPLSQATALAWISGLAWALTVVFVVWAANIRPNPYMGVDTAAISAQASVSAFADFFLLVAVVSTVGLIVLNGVRALQERPGQS